MRLLLPAELSPASCVVSCGQNLPAGMGSLSLLPNSDGGVIDDCIVTNAGDHLYMVINAGHEEKDLPHLASHLEAFVKSGTCTVSGTSGL